MSRPLLLALLVGCGGAPQPASAPPPEAAVEAPPETEPALAPLPAGTHGQMQAWFDATTRARDAVIAGKEPEAREPMRWIATHVPDSSGMPEGWPTHVLDMQDLAGRITPESPMPEIAAAVALTAMECGHCHVAYEVRPAFDPIQLPTDEGVVGHMHRHQWAADRMWEGLILGDADRWSIGAMALLEAPETDITRRDGRPAPPAAAALAERLHRLGREGLTGVDGSQQAAIYGELIATCAECHAITDGGP